MMKIRKKLELAVTASPTLILGKEHETVRAPWKESKGRIKGTSDLHQLAEGLRNQIATFRILREGL
jgi:hypothetical protein